MAGGEQTATVSRQSGPNKSLNKRISEHSKICQDALQSNAEALRAQASNITQAAARLAAAQSVSGNRAFAGPSTSNIVSTNRSATSSSSQIPKPGSLVPAGNNTKATTAGSTMITSKNTPSLPSQAAVEAAKLSAKNNSKRIAVNANTDLNGTRSSSLKHTSTSTNSKPEQDVVKSFGLKTGSQVAPELPSSNMASEAAKTSATKNSNTVVNAEFQNFDSVSKLVYSSSSQSTPHISVTSFNQALDAARVTASDNMVGHLNGSSHCENQISNRSEKEEDSSKNGTCLFSATNNAKVVPVITKSMIDKQSHESDNQRVSSSTYSHLPTPETLAALSKKVETSSDSVSEPHAANAKFAAARSIEIHQQKLHEPPQEEQHLGEQEQNEPQGSQQQHLNVYDHSSQKIESSHHMKPYLLHSDIRGIHSGTSTTSVNEAASIADSTSALAAALKTHSTQTPEESSSDNNSKEKASALAAALAARDSAAETVEKMDTYKQPHNHRKKKRKLYRPSALWSGIGVSSPWHAPSHVSSLPLASKQGHQTPNPIVSTASIANLSPDDQINVNLENYNECELATPIPIRNNDFKYFRDEGVSGGYIDDTSSSSSVPFQKLPPTTSGITPRRDITPVMSVKASMYEPSRNNSSNESLVNTSIADRAPSLSSSQIDVMSKNELSVGPAPSTANIHSKDDLLSGFGKGDLSPSTTPSQISTHKTSASSVSSSKTGLLGLFRKTRPSTETPVGFKLTMRKQHKKKTFNEDKPWKNHSNANVPTEFERKRYEGVWTANKGIHEPLLSDQAREYLAEVGRDPREEIHGLVVRDLWSRSKLPPYILERVWNLVDHNHDGTLDRDGFLIGMWLVDQALYGRKLPQVVAPSVWSSVARLNVKIRLKAKDVRSQQHQAKKKSTRRAFDKKS